MCNFGCFLSNGYGGAMDYGKCDTDAMKMMQDSRKWSLYVNSTIYVGNIKMEKLYRYNREVSTLNRQCLDIILMRVRVMVLNATFNNVSVYHGSQIYWWRKLEYTEKPPTCHKSLTNFITSVVSSTPHHEMDSNSQLWWW